MNGQESMKLYKTRNNAYRICGIRLFLYWPLINDTAPSLCSSNGTGSRKSKQDLVHLYIV